MVAACALMSLALTRRQPPDLSCRPHAVGLEACMRRALSAVSSKTGIAPIGRNQLLTFRTGTDLGSSQMPARQRWHGESNEPTKSNALRKPPAMTFV